MILPLPFKGQSIDGTVLTATATDAKSGVVLIGQGGEEYFGSMPIISAQNKKMALNETYNIPAGYHGGSDRFYQELATMGAQSVAPGGQTVTVQTNGKYMTDNVYVKAVENLRQEVIKQGVTVGSGAGAVVGTFSGWV